MDYQEQYKHKFIDAQTAVGKIKSGDSIMLMGTSAEPYTFLEYIPTVKDQIQNVTLLNSLPMVNYDFYTDESYKGIVQCESAFFSRFLSESQRMGLASYYPVHLRNTGLDRFYYHKQRGKPINMLVVACRPMDEQGYFNTSTASVHIPDAVKFADMVIIEINESLPYTYGDVNIHISDVDYIFQGNNKIVYLPRKDPDETESKIGQNIAELINDGDTIQLGIGGIPNATAIELRTKKHLGVHTEMLNDAIVDLYKLGVVDNSQKTLHRDKIVTSFSFGAKETYDFLHYNPGVLHMNVAYVNNPYTFAQNKNMVSVNTTLQVDLMGQCASESIGTNQISGTGGQFETAMGAKLSENGKSIIALRSTANIKNKEGGRDRVSTIVPVHGAGTVITMLRSEVDYVVTEHGIAALRGASLRDRAEMLINIAHPDFRDDLRAQAKKYWLL